MAFSVSSPLCFLLLLLFLPSSTTAQTYKNISLGSSLTAQNDKNSSWLSPSGEFAFGFQKVSPGAFLLAIWFDKIPEKTIVWSANGDELAPSGSEVKLTTDGQFVLNDPKGQQIWNASSAATGVAYAAMLDTGNLVLADKESVNLWDSFDEPTDTILPTQILKQGTKLVARFSEMNYSRGRFEFSMQTDGNLVFSLKDYPTESADYDYWSTKTVGSGFQVIFNQSGDISLVAKNGSILNQISSYETSTRGFYQRAILGSNGVLRQYVYPKNGSSSTGRWPMAWSASSTFKPDNICTSVAADEGTGVCGLNSYCTLGDDQRTNCNCPPGYVSMDPKDKLSGCKQDFVPQSCEEASQNVNSFDLKAIPNTDWTQSDFKHFQDISEDWCRQECLQDCFCAAAIFRGSECWNRRIPLSNGRQRPDVGGKAFIKVRKDNSTTAQTYKNISLGSSLTAQNNQNSSWPSPSGEFAFGFQKVSPGGFLLAIWFDKIPEKTIVWSANGDKLAPSGSKVQLTTDGQFVLNDPKDQQIWSKSFAGTGVAYAAMLDTGNLVLAFNESVNLWDSFDEPTDTILPTQILKQGTKLVARFSETNYSRGRFEFSMRTDGNLVFSTRAYPKDSVNFDYWLTDTVGSGFQVIFNQSSSDISLVAKNGSILNQISSYETSTTGFYQRAILEYDGVLRQYLYPKNGSSSTGRWPVAWSASSKFKPDNICTSILAKVGLGACGFNSYCTLGVDQRTICVCPPGYVSLDPNDKLSGCKQNFVTQSCEEASQEVNSFELKAMPNTDWPLSDYGHFLDVNEDWCREACLSDCFCAVAIFRGSDCWKKKIPLSNGKQNSSDVGTALIKVRKDNSSSNSPRGGSKDLGGSKEKDRSTLILIGSVLLSGSVFFNIILLLLTLLILFYMNRRKPKMGQQSPIMPGLNLRSFSFEELKEATDGFKEELGRGAFSTVYKGVITLENRNLVAVKKLDGTLREGEQEFEAEVSAIGRTNHKNLVQLLGFCNEGQHRLLVYEFMSNGSLASFLFGDSRPNWYKRIQIAFGTARGLVYLHEECSTQIIHCDIKPQNILLDDSLVARISDFGLAKLLRTDQSQTMTYPRGTKGYVSPEWFKNMPVTVKADVFSFGILLLELICCRKNFEPDVEDESLMILAYWAYDCYRDGKLDRLVENDEEAMGDMKRVEKFVMIALWCIQVEPSLRPSMKKVTLMLEGAVEVSVPPNPSSFISSVCQFNLMPST